MTTQSARITSALRSAIQYQSTAFRDKYLRDNPGAVCPLSGLVLAEVEIEVDHEPVPFEEIRNQWVADQGGEDQIQLRKSDYGWQVAGKQKTSWQNYHAVTAELRCLERQAHRDHSREQQAEKLARLRSNDSQPSAAPSALAPKVIPDWATAVDPRAERTDRIARLIAEMNALDFG